MALDEDDPITRFNRSAARNPLPGVGAPGSTPTTDQTNLNIAAAMDRAELGQRYGFGSPQHQFGVDAPTEVLRQQRDPDEMINGAMERVAMIRSGVDPDRPALYVSPKRQAIM